MTNEEVIERLRNWPFMGKAMATAVADRIEELIAERDQAWRRAAHAEKMWGEAEVKLATCEKYRDAYAECDRIGTQSVRELEAKLKASEEIGRAFEEDAGQLRAKLDKAVEALKCWNRMMQNDAYDLGEMVSEFDVIARTTLAELTGGKDG